MTTTAFSTPYDWKLGTWATTQRWDPTWATGIAPAAITPQLAEQRLRTVMPQATAPNYGDWQRDLAYVQGAQTQTEYPTWLQAPWANPAPQAQLPTTTWNPPQPPALNWNNPGTQATMNMPQWTGGFMPTWKPPTGGGPNSLTQVGAEQAYMTQIVPWAQLMQNTYQYSQDFNEAQRRFNTEQAWAQAAARFDQDMQNRQLAYQQQRDQAEFELGRQQVWGRNQAPNVRWMRNWG